MIELTKLDQTRIFLSLENIKYIEETPDTLIFFTNGESLIVRETMAQLYQRVLDYNKEINTQT